MMSPAMHEYSFDWEVGIPTSNKGTKIIKSTNRREAEKDLTIFLYRKYKPDAVRFKLTGTDEYWKNTSKKMNPRVNKMQSQDYVNVRNELDSAYNQELEKTIAKHGRGTRVSFIYYVSDLRKLFNDMQIKNFLDYTEERQSREKMAWDFSTPSHTQEDDIEWIKKNVNSLFNYRGMLIYYFYPQEKQ